MYRFPAESLLRAGFSRRQCEPARFGDRRRAPAFSYLRFGLIHADRIGTVSPSYAAEIQTAAGGLGMEDVLRRRRARLTGILNGLDLEVWNPQRDGFLPARFGARDPAGKAACRKALLAECGLQASAGAPVVGMVGRLDRQKGWDIAMRVLGPRLGRCRFIGVGEGDPALAEALAKWAARRPGRACWRNGYDEEFAHRLYAGADILLMPSRFEPCGLGQMIAMRYGCVPVVTRTGGLADTVRESGAGANGFLAAPNDPADVGRALDRALAAYARPSWRERAGRGMQGDFSWDPSVKRYLKLYGAAAAAAGR
ncbi:MAG: glycogen/starch synthase [Elusimicrobia bacterium]|nr:glycogen/starch synthase [Elusimicrobiota bacterium]